MFKIICLLLLSSFYMGSQARSHRSKSYSYTVDWMTRAGLQKEIGDLPEEKIDVYYGNNYVNLGNVLTPTQTRFQPVVYYGGCPKSEHYTLVMFDSDAGEYSQVVHWLLTNIKGNDLATADIIADYMPVSPRKTSKPQYRRYTFLVFLQKEKFTAKMEMASSRSIRGRLSFDVQKFAKDNNLGKPVYGNYFYAKYDPIVDKFFDNVESDED